MNYSHRLAIGILALGLTFGSGVSLADGDTPGSLHVSKEGHFQVRSPKKLTKETTDQATNVGLVRVTSEVAELNRDLTLSVVFSDYPATFEKLNADTVIDGVRDGLKGIDGRIISESPVKLGPNGPNGREIRIEAGPNFVRARAWLIGHRLYLVMATGKRAKQRDPEIDEFFQSFEILPKTK